MLPERCKRLLLPPGETPAAPVQIRVSVGPGPKDSRGKGVRQGNCRRLQKRRAFVRFKNRSLKIIALLHWTGVMAPWLRGSRSLYQASVQSLGKAETENRFQ